jgi:hypothetical protein
MGALGRMVFSLAFALGAALLAATAAVADPYVGQPPPTVPPTTVVTPTTVVVRAAEVTRAVSGPVAVLPSVVERAPAGLAVTGADVAELAGFGALLIAAGVVLVRRARRAGVKQ